MDIDKAQRELVVLREFIDFVNRQVGVYSDSLAGFEGNAIRVERQVARIQRPVARGMENGRPVIVYASVEDPSRPDVIHHRIVRADHFVSQNAEAGFNEQQLCSGIIVFLFAYWNDEIRPRIGKIRGVEDKEVKVDALGDLRILRNSIVHERGVVSAADHTKLKVMAELCKPNETIALSHAEMHKLFVFIKQAIAALMLEYSGHLPGAPSSSEILDVAISNHRPTK